MANARRPNAQLRRLNESSFKFFVKYFVWRRWRASSRKILAGQIKMRSLVNKKISPDNKPIILDLGANLGNVSAYFLKKDVQVYAFEPDPRCVAVLRERFANQDNITIIDKAVGIKNGKMILYYNTEGEFEKHSEMSSYFKRDTHDKQVEVDIIDIFEFISKLPKKPYITKMDIEGTEFDILGEMIQRQSFDAFGHMFVETHERFSDEFAQRLAEYRKTLSLHKHINLHWT